MHSVIRLTAALALLGCTATLGCDRAPTNAQSQSGEPSGTVPPFPAWDARAALAAAYGEALQPLPEVTVEMGSRWYGLTIDAGRIGTDTIETSFTAEDIIDELRRQQAAVEAVMKLSERTGRFPDGSPVVGVEDGIGSSGYRNARAAARLLRADAIRALGEGRDEDAARRIAAGLNIVRQLSQGSDISAMVARGVFQLIMGPVEAMTLGVNGHALTPAAKAIVLRGLAQLDPKTPFGPEMPLETQARAVEEYEKARRLLAPDTP